MSPPPPPPPPSSGEEMQHPQHASMYNTPPQRHTKSYGYGYSYGYMARRRTANAGSLDASKSPVASPATSASSAAASPSQLHKTKSASELLSPRVRGRMDPYPRYSPRKRLSADFSDGTYSAGTESPKSEKGGWRIHAAVQGPFLTGPLAQEFVNDVLSPRGKKKEDQDFDDAGLLLFPVVPAYVAPAITPEVFQASIQPQPQVEQQPQPEPDHSVAALPQDDACYYPETASYNQQPTETPAAEASWDQQQYYQEGHQEYYQGTSEEQQYYQEGHQQYYQASAEEQQYYQEQQAAYYYNEGYDQQQYDAANYGYEQSYDQQSYEQYSAVSSELPPAESAAAVEPPSADEFPPLPNHEVAAVPDVAEPVAVEQAAEPLPVAQPPSPVQRPRAPSYAEIVTGAAHSSPRKSETEASSAPRKVSFNAFDQLSEGIAESMTRILAKSKDSKTSHAEVEFTCVVRRIQTQLKLMGKVTKNLHVEQVKTMHKLQQSETEKLTLESTNQQLQQQIKKYEEEQQQLKQQLALALEAKDQRLEAAVDQLTQRLASLKSSADASTATMASNVGSDDLEKRVKEIGDVLDHLVKNQQTGEPSAKALVRKNDVGRQSGGSWKSVALYSLVACAASLSGVWVGINYADDIQHFGTTQPVALEEAAVEAILSQITEDSPATYASQIVEIIENDAVAPEVVVAPIESVFEEIAEPVVEVEVSADLSSAAAVVDLIEAPAVSANWNTEDAVIVAPVSSLAVVEEAVAEPTEEVVEVVEPVTVAAEVEEVEAVEDVAAETVGEVVEAAPEVIEAADEVVEVAEEVVEVVEDVVIPADVAETVVAPVAPVEATQSASPLNGLARALDSLSSRVLAENAPVATLLADAEPVVEELTEEADDVSGSVVELVDAEAAVEVVETVVAETAEAVEYSNSTASVSFEASLVEALSFAAVEEPVVAEIAAEVPVTVEAVEEAARSRWAQEQFLVEVGASCGLETELVAEPELVAVVEPAAEDVAAVPELVEETVSSEWFLEEQPLSFEQFSNVSAPVFVETEMIEKVDVTESAVKESSLEMCSAPVFDLKTQLLTAL